MLVDLSWVFILAAGLAGGCGVQCMWARMMSIFGIIKTRTVAQNPSITGVKRVQRTRALLRTY